MQTLRVLTVLLIVGAGILLYALYGRAGREVSLAAAAPPSMIPVSQLTQRQPVKEIDLEYHMPDMPPGPGHDQFATQCIICHSPRYVLNQPVFPRKTWAAEVHKMVNSYGAPITPDDEEQIVNYLVSWHGKEDVLTASTHNGK